MPDENQRWQAEAAAKKLSLEPVMVDATHGDFASNYMAAATMPPQQRKESMDAYLKEYAQAYGSEAMRDKPFVFYNGLAVIPVHGALLNRFPYAFSCATGYNFIRSQMNMALDDDDVKGIVFDIDSTGGEAAGCMELADEIRAARDVKPSLSVVDSYSCSAAYAIGSAASEMVVTQSSIVGSIGVVAMHIDMSKMLEAFGLDVTFIWAGEDKKEGNFYEKLSDKARAQIQERIDLRYQEFVTLVANNRGLSEDAVRDTKARTFTADDAIELGLIDAVAAPSAAIAQFHDSLSGPPSTESDEMTTQADQQDKTPGAAAPAADGAAAPAVDEKAVKTAERTRMDTIINCDAGKANPTLASHLAFKTDMSAEDAQATLAAAGPTKAAKTEDRQDTDLLSDAMDKTGGGPQVPAGTGDEDRADKPGKAGKSELLAALGIDTETKN